MTVLKKIFLMSVFVAPMMTTEVLAASSVRNLSGATTTTGVVATKTRAGTVGSAAPAAMTRAASTLAKPSNTGAKPVAKTTNTSNNARLSVGQLYNTTNKKTSITGSNNNNNDPEFNASVQTQLDNMGKRIDGLEDQKVDISDVYPRDEVYDKNEIDEMLQDIDVTGLPAATEGDGLYLINIDNGNTTLEKMRLVTGTYTGD